MNRVIGYFQQERTDYYERTNPLVTPITDELDKEQMMNHVRRVHSLVCPDVKINSHWTSL